MANATAGCPPANYVCGCFAGLIDADSRARGEQQLRHLFPGARVRAEPDFHAAFHAAPEGTDVVIIAGTGSLVCSKHGGDIEKSGGGGYLVGDEGSAFQYGRDAIRAYLKRPDRASEAMREAVKKVFGEAAPSEIIAAIYRAPTPAGLLAKFARPLGSDARHGEEYAVESLDRNSRALASVVADHLRARFAGPVPVTVCLAGGLWKGPSIFRDAFVQALQSADSRRLSFVRTGEAPIHGAVRMAKEMASGY